MQNVELLFLIVLGPIYLMPLIFLAAGFESEEDVEE